MGKCMRDMTPIRFSEMDAELSDKLMAMLDNPLNPVWWSDVFASMTPVQVCKAVQLAGGRTDAEGLEAGRHPHIYRAAVEYLILSRSSPLIHPDDRAGVEEIIDDYSNVVFVHYLNDDAAISEWSTRKAIVADVATEQAKPFSVPAEKGIITMWGQRVRDKLTQL